MINNCVKGNRYHAEIHMVVRLKADYDICDLNSMASQDLTNKNIEDILEKNNIEVILNLKP